LGQVGVRTALIDPQADPDFIVIDEIAGVWLTLALVDPTLANCALGALVFRLLDRFKPGPIGAMDRHGGRWSVMGDDLLAGSIAALVVRAAAGLGGRLG
jgi:phosphatidylglycerophosphatase A